MRVRRLAVVLALLLVPGAVAQQGAVPLRYKPQKGDRYVYREVFERDIRSGADVVRTRLVTLNHLVVVATSGDRATVGVQRNRESAELLEYREGGKDRLSRELPKFNERMAKRPAAFADANVYTSSGVPIEPLQTVREGSSELLYAVDEFPLLPPAPAQRGSEWTDGRMGRRMKLVGFAEGSEGCAMVQDAGAPGGPRLGFTFCSQTGLVRRLESEGEYQGFARTVFHEKLTLELLQARKGEDESMWLAQAQTQQATLAAYLLPGAAPPDVARIAPLLRPSAAPEVQAMALSVMLRHGLSLPEEERAILESSKDSQLRRIVARFGTVADPSRAALCNAGAPRILAAQKAGTTLRGMKTPEFVGRPYMMRVPLEYRGDQPFPLIVYLSGGAGKAFDAALTAEDVLRGTGYLALYPQANGDSWWEPKSTAMFSALIDEVLREFNVDTNRVYLTGFSNGGTAAFYYGTLWPQRFAAISSLMGAGVKSPASSEDLPAKNLSDVPLLLVHGDRDPLVPYTASTFTFEEMKRAHPRVAPELQILKGREHDVTLQSDDGLTMPFLERFRREPFPRDVAANLTNTKYGRHYWVEVVAMSGASADVEGHIREGNTIELKTRGVKQIRLLLRPELLGAAGTVRVVVNGKERFVGELKKDCAAFAQSREKYGDPFLAYTDEIAVDLSR